MLAAPAHLSRDGKGAKLAKRRESGVFLSMMFSMWT